MRPPDILEGLLGWLPGRLDGCPVVATRPEQPDEVPARFVLLVPAGGSGRGHYLYGWQMVAYCFAGSVADAMALAEAVDEAMYGCPSGSSLPVARVSGTAPQPSPDPDVPLPRCEATYQLTVLVQ